MSTTRRGQGGADGLFSDFGIGHALKLLELQRIGQMPRDSFSLTIRIGGQEHPVSLFDQGRESGQDILAPVRGNVAQNEIRRRNAHLFDRQIAHMADGRGHFPIRTEKALELFDFARRFHNKQFHSCIPSM